MTAIINLIARVCLSFIFIVSGVSKISTFQATAGYMASKGVPLAKYFLFVAVVFELMGALMVLTGFKAKIGALLLALFLIPVTYVFHVKEAFDASFNLVSQQEFIQALKNVSLLGGLLLVYANGPGKLSIGPDR